MTATFKLMLVRPGVSKLLLPSLNELNIIEEPVFTRPSAAEMINEVKVSYSKREEGVIPSRVVGVGVDLSGETYWAMMSDGYVYAIGWDVYDWDSYGMDNPVVSVHPEGLRFVWAATWEEGLLAIDQNGLLWCIGYISGFTGLASPDEDYWPDPLNEIGPATRAVTFDIPAYRVRPVLSKLCRAYYTAGGIGNDGKVWTWGGNYSWAGLLGVGTTDSLWTDTPMEVTPVDGDNSGWTCLTAGWLHFAGIRNGRLLTWGGDASGCLGKGAEVYCIGLPDFKWGLSSHGTSEYYMEHLEGGDPQIIFPTHVQQYDPYYGWFDRGTIGSLTEGQWNVGDNDGLGFDTIYMRTIGSGNPNNFGSCDFRSGYASPSDIYVGGSDWVKVDCGDYNTIALKSDGTLWGFGQNYKGTFGHEPGGIGCIDPDYVAGDGDHCNHADPINITPPGKIIVDFSAGWYHTVALEADGTAWVTGYNPDGVLGLGPLVGEAVYEWTEITTTKFSVVDCSYNASIGIGLDGKIYIWGELYAGGVDILDVPTVWDFGEYWV